MLVALQKDGRATVGDLAELVSLSQSPCWRRVRQLEDVGLIEGYNARLSRRLLGYGVTGFVHLQMDQHTPEVMAAFEREVVALPEVLSCHNLSGRYDYLIEAIAPDLETFSLLVRAKIRSLPGVKEISTSFSLKEVKHVGYAAYRLKRFSAGRPQECFRSRTEMRGERRVCCQNQRGSQFDQSIHGS